MASSMFSLRQSVLLINLITSFSVNFISAVFNVTKIDLSTCKLSQLGNEYEGTISKTEGGIPCQAWSSEEPLHEVSEDIKDEDFPEKSVKLAKNYCRNPTKETKGPWCYTLEPSLIDDVCDVPLCNFRECRLSGPGAEYGGNKIVSASGKKCKQWSKRHRLVDSKSPEFRDKHFPENSRKKASNFCRNPNGDVGGPWCYVDDENLEYVEKEYCDIPFCDDRDCVSYTRPASTYSILTEFDAPEGNITFWMKLWDPTNKAQGEARILLTVLPIPWTALDIIQKWHTGIEIIFTNLGIYISHPQSNEEEYFESTKDFIVGSQWTGIWINWGGGFISIGIVGSFKSLLIQEYKEKNSIISLYPDTFLQYGILGSNVLWSTEFCQSHCETHVTFGPSFSRVWTIQRNNDTYDIQIFVRASRDIFIRLYQTPAVESSFLTVKIGYDMILLSYQEKQGTANRHLKQIATKGLLNFWIWKEFSISIFGPHLRLFSKQVYGKAEIVYLKNEFFTTLRWFSVGSENTIAKWSFYCSPAEEHPVENPWPPNCVSDTKGFEYQGVQWTAFHEAPCIPWISNEIPEDEKINDKFIKGSVLESLNMCRNPNRDTGGPYCYAIASSNDLQAINITKSYCPIRTCRSSECKMAGTANDYVGTLSVTRSGRTCKAWLVKNYGDSITRKQLKKPLIEMNAVNVSKLNEHKLVKRLSTAENNMSFNFSGADSSKDSPEEYSKNKGLGIAVRTQEQKSLEEAFDDALFPEGSARNASNYCRNPSREIGGTWCYTTDSSLPVDLCNVRDCDKPEEYTILIHGNGRGRSVYILPEYRSEGMRFSIKIWEPDQPDSITFVFTGNEDQRSRYILKIGELDNEKVLLYHESETKGIVLLKKKSLPHLLYLGKWSSFVLRLPRGRVLLLYEGAPEPIFEWSFPNTTNAFLPIYYYYGTEQGHAMAVSFEPDSGCHIENTKTNRYNKVLPVTAWNKEGMTKSNTLTILLRGSGSISIPLFLLPGSPGFYTINLSQTNRMITFTKNTYLKVTIYHKERATKPLFTAGTWTNLTLKWTENKINIWRNGSQVLGYKHYRPLVFYYFSIGVERGWVTWSLDCTPTDIDGPAIDGSWSEWGPWSCSVSCNGGTGTRKRRCDSPRPSIKGEPCIGPSVMTGRCNDIVCGDVTEDTMTLIKRRIRNNHTSIVLNESDSVSIECDRDVIESLNAESPNSEIQWFHNGLVLSFYEELEKRIEIRNCNIYINDAKPEDSGVYAMNLHRVDGSHFILKIVTLAVISSEEKPKQIRETLSMGLKCHWTILSRIYADLEITWTIGTRIWKRYNIGMLQSGTAELMDQLLNVNKSHQGIWKCIVRQNDLNFQWITNAIRVEVLPAPDWRIYLMEDKATRFLFGWLPSEKYVPAFLLFLCALFIAILISIVIFYFRLRKTFIQEKSMESQSLLHGNEAETDTEIKSD